MVLKPYRSICERSFWRLNIKEQEGVPRPIIFLLSKLNYSDEIMPWMTWGLCILVGVCWRLKVTQRSRLSAHYSLRIKSSSQNIENEYYFCNVFFFNHVGLYKPGMKSISHPFYIMIADKACPMTCHDVCMLARAIWCEKMANIHNVIIQTARWCLLSSWSCWKYFYLNRDFISTVIPSFQSNHELPRLEILPHHGDFVVYLPYS